jgi:hypothetical protein
MTTLYQVTVKVTHYDRTFIDAGSEEEAAQFAQELLDLGNLTLEPPQIGGEPDELTVDGADKYSGGYLGHPLPEDIEIARLNALALQ